MVFGEALQQQVLESLQGCETEFFSVRPTSESLFAKTSRYSSKRCLSSCFSDAVTLQESKSTAAGPFFGAVGRGGGLSEMLPTSGVCSSTFTGKSSPILVHTNSLIGTSLLFMTVTGIRFCGPAATTLAPNKTFQQAILSINGEMR